ncbi:MAG: hypothetical protein EOP53_28205 [Sphingobacteriales bacterium]|nr:MAG: hypothetical protein EOP53_28205 [Sphingobacteriales bacterium]
MKNRIAKGKSANNLNGFYVGMLVSYGVLRSFDTNFHFRGAGFGIGYQIQTNRKSFMDISADFVQRQTSVREYNLKNTESIFNLSMKLGFAR